MDGRWPNMALRETRTPGAAADRALESINSCGWLNSPPEACFDRVTQLLSQVFKCPVVSCTLLAQDRLWIKSLIGPHGKEVSKFDACGNYVCVPPTPQVLFTEDASQDARFSHNPYVKGAPYMKFFAAAPLVGKGGTRYGTLCVLDCQKRSFSPDTYNLLANCAELVVMELEQSQALLERWCTQALMHQRVSQALFQCMDNAPNGVALLDARRAAWEVKHINSKFAAACGEPESDLIGSGFWHGFTPMDETTFPDITQTAADAAVLRVDVRCNKTNVMFTLVLRPASSDQMTPGKPLGMPNWVPCDGVSGSGADSGMQEVAYFGLEKCMYLAIIETQEQKSLWKTSSRRGSCAASSPEGSSQFGSLHMNSSDCLINFHGVSGSANLQGGSSSWSYGDFSPPQDMGLLELGPLVGTGAFGKVYRGLWNRERVVALKVIQCFTKDSLNAATNEAEVGLHLSHPNVVKTYRFASQMEKLYEPLPDGARQEVGKVHVVWMVQEYCDWGSLVTAVERGWFHEEQSIFVAPKEYTLYLTLMDIAAGMSHIHASGIIHCDLNGRNVMLQQCASDPRGYVAKVCDFGLAQLGHCVPLANKLAGTISHIPPEQLKSGHASMAGDVWAFGVLMWEAFNGKRAFEDWETSDIVSAVTSGQQRLQMHESSPKAYRDIVSACLQYNPGARPTFNTIVQMLKQAHDRCRGDR